MAEMDSDSGSSSSDDSGDELGSDAEDEVGQDGGEAAAGDDEADLLDEDDVDTIYERTAHVHEFELRTIALGDDVSVRVLVLLRTLDLGCIPAAKRTTAATGAASMMHPGRIGATPNGISRSDGQPIMWSSSTDSTRGYTWDNFRHGWNNPLDRVFAGCMWSCCGHGWDSAGCSRML